MSFHHENLHAPSALVISGAKKNLEFFDFFSLFVLNLLFGLVGTTSKSGSEVVSDSCLPKHHTRGHGELEDGTEIGECS